LPVDSARVAGRWTLTWQAVNVMIGAAVFGIPGAVAMRVGTISLACVLAAAAGVACVVACVAYLAGQFDASGGPYQYARTAFSEPIGGAVGWLYWMSRAASSAAVANVFASNLSLLPARVAVPEILLTNALIWGAVGVNLAGFRRTSGVITVLTVGKLIPVLGVGLVGALAIMLRDGAAARLPSQMAGIGEAILLWVYAFGGFEAAVIPAEEARDPRHDAPIALYRALGIVTAVYLLLQFDISRLWMSAAFCSRWNRPVTPEAAVRVPSTPPTIQKVRTSGRPFFMRPPPLMAGGREFK
jgi:APA family basic amino acid/polyamine antiporter